MAFFKFSSLKVWKMNIAFIIIFLTYYMLIICRPTMSLPVSSYPVQGVVGHAVVLSSIKLSCTMCCGTCCSTKLKTNSVGQRRGYGWTKAFGMGRNRNEPISMSSMMMQKCTQEWIPLCRKIYVETYHEWEPCSPAASVLDLNTDRNNKIRPWWPLQRLQFDRN